MGRGERDDILIWIDWLALDWDCGLTDCGTYFLCRCGLSGQNEILFIALTCFFSKLVSPSSLKASCNFFYHLQPLPSPSSSKGTPNGMIIVDFLSETLSQLDAKLDATYTDAKDKSEHEASGQHKYDITLLRCSFFSTYHSDFDPTKPYGHKFTYQVQYKLMDILYDNWPLYCPFTSVIAQNLSPVYFS